MGEIVPKEPELLAPASIEKTLEILKRFQEFKSKALTEDDYVNIQGRKFIKKSGWLKYALACGLSLEKREERQEIRADEVIYHYTYRAIAPNGRFADAAGSASSQEREFAHETHDVRALAQTRAMERSISNLVGGGELGAEEVVQAKAEPISQTQPVSEQKPLAKVIKWTVKGEDFPIPIEGEQARPYIGLVKNKLMKGLSEKHGIVFEEEVVGGHIVSIKSSTMDEESWNSFYEALNWAVRTIAQCGKQDVKIIVE